MAQALMAEVRQQRSKSSTKKIPTYNKIEDSPVKNRNTSMGTTFPIGNNLTSCDSMTGLNNSFG